MEVLKEHFDDKVEAIGEQYVSIIAKQNEHSEILEHHTQILDKLTALLERHEEILTGHTTILNEHTRKLNEHSGTLEEIKIKIGRIEKELRRRVDYEDFERLQKRVALLELRLRQ